MRRQLFGLPLILLAAASGAGAADNFRVSGLKPDSVLHIRETPDASAPVIGEIPWNGRLLAFGCTNETPSGYTWCRVKYGPVVGWARRRYLQQD